MLYVELRNTEYGVVSVHTTRKQFGGYIDQEVEKEKLERDLKGMTGHPTDHKYKDAASKKLPPNCPITTNDITNTDYMFGTDIAGVRGNKVRNKPSRADT